MTTTNHSPTVTTVLLEKIVVDPTIQIRKGTREETIRRYMECWEYLPPITLFDTGDGRLLLADGFHRHGAGTRLAQQGDLKPAAIKAEVRKGTREEALEFAVLANAATGEKLTNEERDAGIRRLRQLHPQRGERAIAQMMGVSEHVVHKLAVVDRVLQHVLWKPAARIARSLVYEVGMSPEEYWEPLLRAADKRAWTRDQLRRVRELLDDDDVPGDYKRSLVAGDVDPLPPGMTRPAPLIPVDFASDLAEKAEAEEEEADEAEDARSRWQDPVGADVAERHYPVLVTLQFEYQLRSDEVRRRGAREYRRESEHIVQRVETTVNRKALDGLGDPRRADNDRGLAYGLQQAMREAWKQLYATWPEPAQAAAVR